MKHIDFANLKNSSPWQVFLRFVVMTIGCALYACSVALFIDPNNLVLGGFTGISIMLSRYIPINTGIIVLIMNIPLLILGLIKFGKAFLFSTVYSTIVSSLFITLFDYILTLLNGGNPVVNDKFMSVVLGAVLAALGLSLIFRMGATTGGVEIIARLIRLKFQRLSIGRLLMMMDMVVIVASAFGFGEINVERAIYSGVTIVILDVLFDKLLYGYDHAKLLHIITQYPDQLKARILKEVNTGLTVLDGHGGYSGEEKKILMVVVKKHLYPKLKDVVKEEDPDAFIIVSSATEIYGLGYKKNDKKEI